MLNINPESKLGGTAVPLFALRGTEDLGIGDVQALWELIEWSAAIGLKVIQILPINEMAGDCSPYHILSSMAIEPLTIATTPNFLPDLKKELFDSIIAKFNLQSLRSDAVCYPMVKSLKLELLQAAFSNLKSPKRMQAFQRFYRDQQQWLEPYALFRSILHLRSQSTVFDNHWLAYQPHKGVQQAKEWVANLQHLACNSLKRLQTFYSYVQWVAFSQWHALRNYAEAQGVALMGDVPLGVSLHSADVWEFPQLFDCSRFCGAPPEKVIHCDLFTKKWGQNWGFPLYRWNEMQKDDFQWWRRRLHMLRSIFHLLRLDHALGFFRLYTFPWPPNENACFTHLNEREVRLLTGGRLPRFVEQDDSTEEHRRKNHMRGKFLLSLFLEEVGSHRLIAEDLGIAPPYVRSCLEALEIPSLKIPFWEKTMNGLLVAGEKYPRISLATYATHDHLPIRLLCAEWSDSQSVDPVRRRNADTCMRQLLIFSERVDLFEKREFTEEVHLALLKGLFATNSWLAVPLITDLLGTNEQFNIPGSVSPANWSSRLRMPISLWAIEKKSIIGQIHNLLRETYR